MVLTLDNLPAHLPSHSSTTLLLHTTFPFSDNPLPTLSDSGTMDNFINKSLAALAPYLLRRLSAPIPLKLFDGDPTPTGYITHHLEAWLLITQLPPLTPIVLGLMWLQDVNPDINWKNLTMQFPSPKATLAAAIPLCLQSILDSDVSHPSASTSGATQSPSTSDGNPNGEESTTLPWPLSIKLQWPPPNIPQN
ncbi:hypothetical protein C0989_000756 [Termitomyces sp. Mn162]|nr:hypothetical protein C0989_000756 [Termitomyces sp. Mn162]